MTAVAIVGSGPAGCYMVDALAKALPGGRIDVFERLPFPYGLVRYGVAADHQGTKNVAAVFARFMKRPGVRFFGGVEVGRAIALDDLRSRYDAVVVATGAVVGRKAGIQGADLPTSVTALDLVRWFNGHPDFADFAVPCRPASVCVIGNGNVSLDLVRLFAKTPGERAGTDLHPPARAWLDGLRLDRITVCGRRSAGDTRFAPAELAELAELAAFAPVVDPGDVAGAAGDNPDARDLLRRYAERPADRRRPIRFLFDQEMLSYGDGMLRICTHGGAPSAVAADLLIHAVGQRSAAIPGLPFDGERGVVPNADGLVAGTGSVYVVGWAARAGSGTIARQRNDAQAVAARLAARLREGGVRHAPEPIEAILPPGPAPVTWDDWSRLDAIEVEAGRAHGCVRRKLVSREDVDAALAGAAV